MTDDVYANQTVTFEELTQLIEVLPDTAHLTIIGGQALSFWYLYYSQLYPELLEEQGGFVGTKDIDFMADKASMEICANAWGVDLYRGEASSHLVGQIGVMEISLNGRKVIIDFLTDYARSGPIKDRYKKIVPLSDRKSIFVLDPQATLLSKISNTVALNRTDEHSIGQIRAAMAVLSCAIREAIDSGDEHLACKLIRFVFDVRKADWYGRKIKHYGIELIDLFTADVQQLNEKYLQLTFLPEIQRIKGYSRN